MLDPDDNAKEPTDAGSSTPQSVGRSRQRRSRQRRMSSETSAPMRDILDEERATVTAKRAKFFSSQVQTDASTGSLSYKVVNPVKIDGVTHQAGEMVLLETVERWSKTPEDSGTPPPERDSDSEEYRDSGDPDNVGSNIYPSPMADQNVYWCWSCENENLIQVAFKPAMLVPLGSIFVPPAVDASSISYQAIKEKFVHTSSNPFKFYKLSYSAMREIQDLVVAHMRKTTRAEQDYSLFECFKDELRRDIVTRLRTHKEYAARPNNAHRRDGKYLENDISETFLSQLEPHYILPLLLIATLPLIDTAGRGSHESSCSAILRYESQRFMRLHSSYFCDRIALFQNYSKVHDGIKLMTSEILRYTRITEWWMGKWYPVKSYNTNITSWTVLLNDAFAGSGSAGLSLQDLYSLWAVTDRKYRHFSHLLKDKLAVSWRMEQDLQPSAAHLMKLDGIIAKQLKSNDRYSRSSSPSGRSVSSGNTTRSSSSSASTGSNTSTLTTNNIGNTDSTALDTISSVQPYTKPNTPHIATRQSVSFQRPPEDRPTPVCYVQLVKGICNKDGCDRLFSHDEAILNKTRKDLIRSWSTGTTMGASRTNNTLLQQLNVNMSDEDDLQDIVSFISNMDIDVVTHVDSSEEELDQE